MLWLARQTSVAAVILRELSITMSVFSKKQA